MDSSSGKSIGRRLAICSGLHARAHRRSWRLAWLRPFHRGAAGPGTTTPSGRRTCPARRSWTYSRSRSLTTSLAVFGRRATSSAFHCATPARYSSFPPRVAALRRSSLEIVDGSRPTQRAISRTPAPCARSTAISSRSANDRYRPESRPNSNGDMPPPSRNHRLPAACDAPTSIPASSLVSPLAIKIQNSRSTSRRSDGAPGDFIGDLPVNSFIHPAGLPINTSEIKVLRRPVESALGAVVRVNDRRDRAAGLDRHVERVDDQLGVLDVVDGPADDLATVGVHHGAAVDLALPGRVLCDVGDPQLVRSQPVELAVDQVVGAHDATKAFDPRGPRQAVDRGVMHQDRDEAFADLHSHAAGEVDKA